MCQTVQVQHWTKLCVALLLHKSVVMSSLPLSSSTHLLESLKQLPGDALICKFVRSCMINWHDDDVVLMAINLAWMRRTINRRFALAMWCNFLDFISWLKSEGGVRYAVVISFAKKDVSKLAGARFEPLISRSSVAWSHGRLKSCFILRVKHLSSSRGPLSGARSGVSTTV